MTIRNFHPVKPMSWDEWYDFEARGFNAAKVRAPELMTVRRVRIEREGELDPIACPHLDCWYKEEFHAWARFTYFKHHHAELPHDADDWGRVRDMLLWMWRRHARNPYNLEHLYQHELRELIRWYFGGAVAHPTIAELGRDLGAVYEAFEADRARELEA